MGLKISLSHRQHGRANRAGILLRLREQLARQAAQLLLAALIEQMIKGMDLRASIAKMPSTSILPTV